MFDTILKALVKSVPGARGAVFCDGEGETVRCVGASGRAALDSTDDYELRVAGAQLAEPLDIARGRATELLGNPVELCVRGRHETLLVRTLPDGYYLVLCLAPNALPAVGLARLREAAMRVRREM